MNDTLKKVLMEHADYIPLKKERACKEEACTGTKIKPGYARMFDNMEDTYVRYDCTDDDVVAAKLKIDFDILNRVKKIHFGSSFGASYCLLRSQWLYFLCSVYNWNTNIENLPQTFSQTFSGRFFMCIKDLNRT